MRGMGMLRAAVLGVCLAVGGAGHASPTGVIRVIDADTLDIGGERVRLYGLDAPEIGQPCELAGQVIDCGTWVAGLVRAEFEGQRARCTTRDIDRFGRQVATCDVAGRDMGAVIVSAGWAVAYRRFSDLYDLDEKAAAVAGRGVWAARFETPEAYRAADQTPAAPDPACTIKGNISSSGYIYHRPHNRDYARTRIDPSRGERWFCSEADARAAGWRPARN
jgi:endonuclease YncB( thermonuclease family)